MIAKVAEMHALRKACPEELSQAYIAEEKEKEVKVEISIDIDKYENELKSAKNIDELKKIWSEIPAKAKVKLENLKNEIKLSYENTKI